MLKMTNKIELIIPNADNNGNVIQDARLEDWTNAITNICGGLTMTEVRGAWWSDDEKRIMIDNNINYEWYLPSEDLDVVTLVTFVNAIITALVKDYEQEAVSVKINGILYLVFPSDLKTLANELNTIIGGLF